MKISPNVNRILARNSGILKLFVNADSMVNGFLSLGDHFATPTSGLDLSLRLRTERIGFHD